MQKIDASDIQCNFLCPKVITKLDGFPKLQRLSMLLLSNNRITRIATGLNDVIPNLEWLVLTNNQMRQLKDLDPLSELQKLCVLSLVGNPITKIRGYWHYTVHICKNLKMLDFKKVKQKDREMAEQMYGAKPAAELQENGNQQKEQQKEQQQIQQKLVLEQNQEIKQVAKTPTAEELMAIKAAIANAQTIEEVRRLEQVLQSGKMPSNMQFGVQNNSQQQQQQKQQQPGGSGELQAKR
eukprot:TRINITY_DN4889_c1_g2_i1.p3 TRINITY_DN4889_c1_g2~~TRINITY_DN4889_c1_g2_i1.p3  ORF type:complete len:238 (-),score=47.28 TRINITY_DN4889_c1_g2_i1:688-1401(-)